MAARGRRRSCSGTACSTPCACGRWRCTFLIRQVEVRGVPVRTFDAQLGGGGPAAREAAALLGLRPEQVRPPLHSPETFLHLRESHSKYYRYY